MRTGRPAKSQASRYINSGFGWRALSRGDSADEVFLLESRLRADCESVQKIQRERVTKRFVLAIAQLALAKDFHAHNGLAVGTHLAEDTHDRFRCGVHISA